MAIEVGLLVPIITDSLAKLDEKILALKKENARISGEMLLNNTKDPKIYSFFLQELQKKIQEDKKQKAGDGVFREAGSGERIDEILTTYFIKRQIPYSPYPGGDIMSMGTGQPRGYLQNTCLMI